MPNRMSDPWLSKSLSNWSAFSRVFRIWYWPFLRVCYLLILCETILPNLFNTFYYLKSRPPMSWRMRSRRHLSSFTWSKWTRGSIFKSTQSIHVYSGIIHMHRNEFWLSAAKFNNIISTALNSIYKYHKDWCVIREFHPILSLMTALTSIKKTLNILAARNVLFAATTYAYLMH